MLGQLPAYRPRQMFSDIWAADAVKTCQQNETPFIGLDMQLNFTYQNFAPLLIILKEAVSINMTSILKELSLLTKINTLCQN